MNLHPVLGQGFDIVESVGRSRMPGDKGLLPAAQAAVDLLRLLGQLTAKRLELLAAPGSFRIALQLLQPLTQLDQGLFEWHILGRHDSDDASKGHLASQFGGHGVAIESLRVAHEDRHRPPDHLGTESGSASRISSRRRRPEVLRRSSWKRHFPRSLSNGAGAGPEIRTPLANGCRSRALRDLIHGCLVPV